jgi:hypothetical protein
MSPQPLYRTFERIPNSRPNQGGFVMSQRPSGSGAARSADNRSTGAIAPGLTSPGS